MLYIRFVIKKGFVGMQKTSRMMRWIIYSLMVICPIWVVIVCKPHPRLHPHGIILPLLNTQFTPNLETNIRIYPFTPSNAKILARINIEEHYQKVSDKMKRQIEKYAKKLAAKVGADGIVIKAFAYSDENSPTSLYIFRGIAIHLAKQVKPS